MMKDIHTIASFGELEVYEPDDAAKDPYAKFFRMSDVLYFTEQTTKKEEELIGTLFRQFAELSRYEFFTKKLWKKVKGFKNKNEAKVIAWADSCYRDETINPEQFSVYPYNPHILTMANSKTYYAVLTSQIHICDKYDEEDAATKPD